MLSLTLYDSPKKGLQGLSNFVFTLQEAIYFLMRINMEILPVMKVVIDPLIIETFFFLENPKFYLTTH